MAGRGRGVDIFRKLAKLQLEEEENIEDQAAAVAPTDTEATDIAGESEVETKLQKVDEYYRARFGDAETVGDGSTISEPSVGTGTYVAPFKTYLTRVRGEDSVAPPSELQTVHEAASEQKITFPMAGRGRGMFGIPDTIGSKSGFGESTSESEKTSEKKPADTPVDTSKLSSGGAIPRTTGRGRGIILTSGEGLKLF
jgi:hypothetical protein